MTLTLCAVLMQTVLSATSGDISENYAEARRLTAETGKPMVVMVGTDWCVPCQSMKRNILPKLRERGLFKRVSLVMVNADRESELAKEITGGGPVPQLVMYRKTNRGWSRSKLIGSQPVEDVEKFIKEELASDDADRKKEKNVLDAEMDLWDLLYFDISDESDRSTDVQSG